MNRNVQHRIAPWFTGRDPAVAYVDQHMVDVFKNTPEKTKAPTAPGHWWSADDGWTGPFASHDAALADGRAFLKAYNRPHPRR
jgi:hypothetical protein